jgi:hypothetical protein
VKEKKTLLGVKLTGGLEEEMTAWAGTSLVEIGRKCGAMEVAERVLPPKKSVKGLTQGQMVDLCFENTLIPFALSLSKGSPDAVHGSTSSPRTVACLFAPKIEFS